MVVLQGRRDECIDADCRGGVLWSEKFVCFES